MSAKSWLTQSYNDKCLLEVIVYEPHLPAMVVKRVVSSNFKYNQTKFDVETGIIIEKSRKKMATIRTDRVEPSLGLFA